MRIGTALLPVLCLLLSLPATVHPAQATGCRERGHLVFGILPFISAEHLVVRFTPLARYLSTNLGIPVRLETAPDFVEFARRTHEDHHYDILFTAPHFYIQAHEKAGYELAASVDSPGMWAIIVVPEDSAIRSLDELRGKRLSTVPPMGLATLLVRNMLFDNGIDPDVDLDMIITPSHDAALLSSYHGVTDASALMQPPFDSASDKVRNSMRVIARTASTPHIPISIAPWLEPACATRITDLLVNMGNTPEGREVLLHNNFTGFRKGDPAVYEELNKMLGR